MTRSGLTLLIALAATGCTSDAGFSDAAASSSFDVSGSEVDILFAPPTLRTGESIVAESGDIRMTSTAGDDAHRVRLTAPGRTIRRVVGLLDGESQLTTTASDHEADGGTTSLGPTSVHRRSVCRRNMGCAIVTEFDYDLHDPSGDGTTQWRTPDGRSATIDRLRFELEATESRLPEVATVRVTTPEPLALVRTAGAR